MVKSVTFEHANSAYLPGFELAVELSATSDLGEAVCQADLVVVGVPTSGFRHVLEEAARYMRPWIPVVSLSKGLEGGSHLRMTEVISQVVPGHPVAALTGPNIAHEIMSGKAAAAVIATEDLEVASAIQKVFTRGVFRVYVNDDVVGCEMGGALKNVIAIAVGCSDGFGFGLNARAALMTRGLAEMGRLAVRLGAHPLTLAGLAGFGDLVLTCTGELSRNRQVGLALARGETLPQIVAALGHVAEGIGTARTARALADELGVEMPITHAVASVLHDGVTARDAVTHLLARETRAERA